MRAIAVVAVCGALAACGGDDGSRPAPEAASSATPTAAARTGAEAEIADVVERYMAALSDADWEAACGTRSRAERASLARTAGSCERAFAAIAKNQPAIRDIVDGARVGDIRIRGDVAGADVVHPGQTQPATTFAVVKRRGEWLLEDTDDHDTP